MSRFLVAILPVLLGLSGCVTASDTIDNPNALVSILSMPKTATMPTGSGSYLGRYVVVQNSDDSSGAVIDRWQDSTTADLQLNANFNNRSIAVTLRNMVSSGKYETATARTPLETDVYYTEFAGQSTGTGTITGVGGTVAFAANLNGTFTAARVGTSASDAQTATGDAVFSVSDPIAISGEFRGAAAQALYGQQSQSTGTGAKTTTIWAELQ